MPPPVLHSQRLLLRPFQIAVEVSLSVGGRHSPIFPAILDTGHSHNFSIRHDQLRDWAGLALRQIGLIKVNQQIVPLAECDLVVEDPAGKTFALRGGGLYLCAEVQGDITLSRPLPGPWEQFHAEPAA